jgi:hypothetical protein
MASGGRAIAEWRLLADVSGGQSDRDLAQHSSRQIRVFAAVRPCVEARWVFEGKVAGAGRPRDRWAVATN